MLNPSRFAQYYASVFSERFGLDVDMLDDGGLLLHIDGNPFYIGNSAPDDPEYVNVFVVLDKASLGRGKIADQTLLTAANRTNGCVKCAKVLLSPQVVAISYEMVAAGPRCLPSSDLLALVLPRAVELLQFAVRRFLEELELAGIEAASAA